MRILVIEDYPPVRKAVVQALREEGYSVDECGDGEEGLFLGSGGGYDVIVLDWMLPGMDGLELLRRIRDKGGKVHVIMLTARDSVDDRVVGLDGGADDYLVKPFAMEELLARVRALVRREYDQKAPVLEVGHVVIQTADHTVRIDDEAIELTAKEYALLEYLAHRTGQVVSRTEIWQHIYDERSTATSNVVDVYIGYLRKKLERPDRPKVLHTRRGEGYVFGPRLEEAR